jgi:molybdopterin molybdotransferase
MLFLRPAVLRLAGHRDHALPTARAKLAAPLAANDVRQEYLRASLARDRAGELVAAPFPVQDSSMMSTLAKSGCLVVRPPLAPAAAAGEAVEIIALEQLAAGL